MNRLVGSCWLTLLSSNWLVQIPDMSTEVAKLEELVERIVQEDLPLAKKATAKHRGLPAKYLLKQFFASFKEYREQKARFKSAKLDALVQAMHQVMRRVVRQ